MKVRFASSPGAVRRCRPVLAALALASGAAHAAPSELFFSEYIEGSSSNKAIEIYNGTGAAVNLTGYSVQLFTNGSAAAGATLNLSGTLANNDVYVIANSAANAAILAAADITNGVANFNGNDALTLRNGTTVIDSFGQVGFNPGTAWIGGGISTVDQTLVRKPTVCAGDANSVDAFDPSVEWNGLPNNDTSSIGSHSVACSAAPALSVANVAVLEGSSGITQLTFTVTLTNAAAGGFSVDFTTVDGTATVADNDYVTAAGTINFAGTDGETHQVNVSVNGDLVAEANETFTLTLANPSNPTVMLPAQAAVGTITNDDLSVTAIPAIQGTGVCSPFVGSCSSAAIQGNFVRTEGNVVTAVSADGFALQDPVGDGDSATSDGIYVFTLAAPVTDAGEPIVVGDVVNVLGRVDEYFFFTELTVNGTRGAQHSIVRTAQDATLPAPVVFELDGADGDIPSLDPAALYCGAVGGVQNNFECLESMLVSIPDGIVTNGNQRYATPVDDDYAQVHIGPHGNRSLREPNLRFGLAPGAGNPDALVADGNPEVLEMDADKFLAVPFGTELVGGAKFAGTGVIGYSFSDYEFWPSTLDVDAATNVLPRPVPASVAATFTVGSFNVLRLCNTLDDEPGDIGQTEDEFTCDGNGGGADGEPTQAEYEAKRAKVGTYIVDVLRAPDVVGLQEVETLAVLQDLATWIGANGGPAYQAYLLEGHDVGGIDVGYLVNPARVANAEVAQLRFDQTWDDPVGGDTELHDRPPLLLQGEFLSPAGAVPMPFAIINNHLRSRGGVDTSNAAGERVRAKRFLQAKAVAEEVQAFQTANPAVPLLLVGDYNAFQFSDGFVDMVGLIAGVYDDGENTCAPANSVTSCDLGPDGNITNPPLVIGVELADENERYSYEFTDNLGNIQGQARDPSSHQVIDHVLFAQSVLPLVADVAYGRANSDASAQGHADGTGPDGAGGTQASLAIGSSDHDGLVAFISTDCAANPAADGDGDGVCNVVDNCPLVANAGQADGNNDGIGDACNSAPTFTSDAVTTATQGVQYTYAITTTDADGNVAGISATQLPAWLTLVDNGDGTATLSGTPTQADVGVHDVTLRATDGSAATDQAFQITVDNVNDVPVLDPDAYVFTVQPGAVLNTTVGRVLATDPDGDTLVYSIIAGNAGGAWAIEADGDIVVADSAAVQPETVFELVVQVADGSGATDTATVQITVDAIDHAPVFDPASYTFSIDADAANGDAVGSVNATHGGDDVLAYSIDSGNANGAFAIDTATGAITVADATQLAVGTVALVVRATDEDGDFVTASVDITIEAPPGPAIFADGFED